MIKINKITKHYNAREVLNIQELQILEGEYVGLVGNNGAGKTTLFSLILDLIRPTTGDILIQNQSVSGDETWKMIASSFIDESFLIGHLTPEEYFYFIGELRGLKKADVDEFLVQYEDFFNDEILRKKKYLRDFSKGNQKKAGLVASLLGNPTLIIWDEPFANLDPRTQIRLKEIIQDLKTNSKKTMLISSHDLSHTVDVTDRIVALEKGRIVKDIVTTNDTLQELEDFFKI